MAKKTRKSRKTQEHEFKVINSGVANWHPLDDEIDNNRDQKFVKNVKPRSEGQADLMQSIREHSLTMAIGPAGTGKTYLAISLAVEALLKGEVERIILSRPAMEAGESIGFLPGDLHEKMAPYLRPLYDALGDRMGGKKVRQLIDDGTIEIAPVGFMRGRTLNNAFVVIDEAQNCTYSQLKMLLSRLGWHSTMVVTGDPDQSDLLEGISGLADISNRLEPISRIGVVRLSQEDIVRHPLVADMLGVL
ncbi:MAG: phosphate starvation-inducible protein PhoH [Alphaproteobacteria bacterium]|nr:phosphate starvation-inducible protein PhoH [Alphaproteobacteria bacterium]|tara:strand:+ start:408 stop:1148 length:741 start_codon:yes stop_codon:yes gene_type:complete